MAIKQYETTNMINEMLFHEKYHASLRSFKLQVRQTFILVQAAFPISRFIGTLLCLQTNETAST